MTTEKIITESGIQLYVEKHRTEDNTEISLETDRHEGYLLHWGVGRRLQQTWQTAPKALWPEGSKAVDEAAVQTPFREQNGGYRIVFSIDHASFSLFFSRRKIIGIITGAETTESKSGRRL
jgi:hypothetical protein